MFASVVAETGNDVAAAREAKYKHPEVQASKIMRRPAVLAEIARIQQARLIEEGLPVAVQCLLGLLKNEKAPAGARVTAAKYVIDRAIGVDAEGRAKDPHEMTPEELQGAIDRLRREVADRAKPVIDGEARVVEAQPTVFD